jgi:hypothetical protein
MRNPIRSLLTAVLLVSMPLSLIDCSKSSMMGGLSGAFNAFGGQEGLTKLASAFGSQILGNSTLNSVLGSSVDQITSGLTTSVLKMSGLSVPEGSVDLPGALKGKVDKQTLPMVGTALTDAGKSLDYGKSQMEMLGNVWKAASKDVL